MRDERLSRMPMIERPTQLRLGGFVLTVAGGSLIAIGTLLTWASVDYKGITSKELGVDLKPGLVCLVLGVIAILAIPALRAVYSIPLRRVIAVAVVVAGLVAIVLGVRELSIKDHLLFTGIRTFAESLHQQNGLPAKDLATQIRADLKKSGSVNVGIGLWITIAGGMVALGGGVLDLIWVRSRARARAHAFDAPPTSS
jgi:hypothetical protein